MNNNENKNSNTPEYRLGPTEVLHTYNTSRDGLSSTEAQHRLERHGLNALSGMKKDSAWRKYIRQYKDLMILLLLASSVISFYLGDARTAVVLLVIILFNTVLGFVQEYKAERIMQALEKLVKPEATVYRDGTLLEVDSSILVPGDIVRISEGDFVPADLRLVQESELSTNDFALTGESNPSRKFTHAISGVVELGSRHNLAFMGTTVATGEATGVVIATGMQTELGRIASLSEAAPKELSPLQKEMNFVAKRVTMGVVFLCTLLLPISIHANLGIKDAFLFAIAFASSLVPQGLPAEINTALAQAANKLAKAKALVKKLSSVETLGATHIICTDKTGTLTKNQMTVERVIIGFEKYLVSGAGYEANGSIQSNKQHALDAKTLKTHEQFFMCGACASNAKVLPPDTDHADWYCLGDPTEGALITLANKAGINIEELEKTSPEIKEFTFDSARKRMTSIRKLNGQLFAFVKGAPEGVLDRCTHIAENGRVRKLTKSDVSWYMQQHELNAKHAMRNLAFAVKTLPAKTTVQKLEMDDVESGLTLLGMVSMQDPLREQVPDAMQEAQNAHISINIVTGDYSLTAKAIAKKAGLVGKGQHFVMISGDELKAMDDRDILYHATLGGTIFSRVSPEDKLRIVEIVKKANHVVAVTGDGINDAPALKRADIGVAMGITGTDVAKQSSDIVLLDDSFHTLVSAVQQGRIIFSNIKKGTLSCFTSNTAELFTNLASLAALSVLGIPLAIGVMQILAVDLIAELFPIAALGWDPAEGALMHEEPRDPTHHILSPKAIVDLLCCGFIIGTLAFSNYLLFFHRAQVDPRNFNTGSTLYFKATTMTYVTIVCCQLLNIMQRRSVKGIFSRYQLRNWHFWLAVGFSVCSVLVIVYNPWVNTYFKSGPLSVIDWLYAFGAGIIFVSIREVQRALNKKLVASPTS